VFRQFRRDSTVIIGTLPPSTPTCSRVLFQEPGTVQSGPIMAGTISPRSCAGRTCWPSLSNRCRNGSALLLFWAARDGSSAARRKLRTSFFHRQARSRTPTVTCSQQPSDSRRPRPASRPWEPSTIGVSTGSVDRSSGRKFTAAR